MLSLLFVLINFITFIDGAVISRSIPLYQPETADIHYNDRGKMVYSPVWGSLVVGVGLFVER